MLATADDVVALKDRYKGGLDHQIAHRVFDRLVEGIEPTLVITDEGGAVEWLEAVAKARDALWREMRGIAPGFLDKVAEVARKYQKIAGAMPQRQFTFFKSADLRGVAEQDWSRAVAAGQREDAKTAAIAGGSVVEAIALDILTRLSQPDAARLQAKLNGLPASSRRNLFERDSRPDGWSFGYLLLALSPTGVNVLTERTHDIGHKLRDWRNYVHPGKARSEAPLSAADGRLAVGFTEKVIEEATAWDSAGAKLVV